MSTEEIMNLVSEVLDVPLEKLKKVKGDTDVVRARYVCCTLMIEEEIHYLTICEALGLKDRQGFYHMKNSINERFAYDKQFKKDYLNCIAQIARMEGIDE